MKTAEKTKPNNQNKTKWLQQQIVTIIKQYFVPEPLHLRTLACQREVALAFCLNFYLEQDVFC